MAYRIYIENLSTVRSNQTYHTFRGSTVEDLITELRQKLQLSETVRIDVYNKRFGMMNRYLVKSFDILPSDHDSFYVFLRPQ
jgi:hypothetical protein